METKVERRREKRLRYHWPVWFAEDFDGLLSQGQMVDISSGGAAFTCIDDYNCPCAGQTITTRFSVPKFEGSDSFNMASFVRNAHICRVDDLNSYTKKIAVQFSEPLPFKPGHQAEDEEQCIEKMQAVTI